MPPIAPAGPTMLGVKLRPNGTVGSKKIETVLPAPNESMEAETYLLSFSRSQLSLALSILRSKPADTGVREYCLQLQKNIKQGKPLADGEHRYIDTAGFWKDQYSKIHLENVAMQMQLAQLKALNDEKNPNCGVATSELCSFGATIYHQHETTLNDTQSINNLPLLRQALNLHRLLQDDKVSTDLLTSAINSILSHMSSTIDVVCDISNKEHIRNRGSFDYNTFKIVSAIFNICLKGLAHMCRHIPGRRCKGQVIFCLVRLFRNILNHLSILCLQQKEYQPPNISNSEDQDSYRAHHEDTTKILTLTSELTSLLVNILTCPEFHNAYPSYAEVLEGMFAILLEDAGALISQLVFKERLSSAREFALESSPYVTGPASVNPLAIDLKCQRLAYILRRVLGGKPEKDNYSLAAVIAGTNSVRGASKKPVLARASQRLQETLLNGVFGHHTEQFINALQMPKSEECWDNATPQILSDERDAFLESVWALVGWDKLQDN